MSEASLSVPAPLAPVKPNIYCHATPGTWEDIHALQLLISKERRAAFNEMPRGQGDTYIVAFDRLSRKYYAIRRYPCFCDSWECGCSAQAQEVKGRHSMAFWPPIPWVTEEEIEEQEEEEERERERQRREEEEEEEEE